MSLQQDKIVDAFGTEITVGSYICTYSTNSVVILFGKIVKENSVRFFANTVSLASKQHYRHYRWIKKNVAEMEVMVVTDKDKITLIAQKLLELGL